MELLSILDSCFPSFIGTAAFGTLRRKLQHRLEAEPAAHDTCIPLLTIAPHGSDGDVVSSSHTTLASASLDQRLNNAPAAEAPSKLLAGVASKALAPKSKVTPRLVSSRGGNAC